MADSVIVENSKVSLCYDLSSNGYNATQLNETNRPTFFSTVSDINNMPSMNFDGINDALNGTVIPDINQSSLSVFIIARNNPLPPTGSPGGLISFGNYGAGLELMRQSAGAFGYYQNGSNFNSSNNEDCSPDGTPFRLFYVTKQLNNESKIYVNTVLRNSSTLTNITNTFTNSAYKVGYFSLSPNYWNGSIAEIIIYNNLLDNTARQLVYNYLRYKYAPPVNLSYDIRIPYGWCDTAITTAYKPWFTNYAWSTGETDSIIHVSRPGIYSVTVTDIFGFTSSDDIHVFFPEIYEIGDTMVCYGNQIVWDTEVSDGNVGDYTYEWYQSTEISPSLLITDPGQYAAIVTDSLGCKYFTDTINFSFDLYEFTASIGPQDTALCSGNRLLLVQNADETATYLWSTGSTNPEIVLATTGEYSVSVTSDRGCSAVDTINVTINGQAPFPAFSSVGHCAENEISFSDESTSGDGNINSWTWFIDGEFISSTQNLDYTFLDPGTYNVNLAITTDNDCGDFIVNPITVYPLPNVDFSPDYFCQNTDIVFNSTSNISQGDVVYNFWDFGDNTFIGPNAIHNFAEDGNQTVKLICSSDQSCTDSLTREIFVKSAEKPWFYAENTCIGDSVYFINTTAQNPVNPGRTWLWNFDDGNTADESNPVHVYNSGGNFSPNLTINYQNGCQVSNTIPIQIYPKAEVELIGLDACLSAIYSPEINSITPIGDIAAYHWQIGTPQLLESELQSPNFVLNELGSYPISLEVSTNFACKSLVDSILTVHENPVSAFSSSRLWGAVPLWVDFVNESDSADYYYWDFGDGIITEEFSPYHIFEDSGSFDVRLISYSAVGCSDTSYSNVKVVIPVMDIILYNLRTEIVNNYLKTSVYVINNGTLPAYDLELILNLGNGKIYRETIALLESSAVLDYTFNVEAYIADANNPEVLCVEAIVPPFEIYEDINPANNVLCNTDVNNLRVFQPFPNPASTIVYCEYIVKETSTVTTSLINSMGEVVYKNVNDSFAGYKKLSIDVSGFAQGIYFIQVRTDEETMSFKVAVE
jgi:PKD repeat protein